jgi:hypothetical protein
MATERCAMAATNDDTMRRVYVLPVDLVERIAAFQKDRGYNSEVEAVRKLLDDALRMRETPDDVVTRFLERLSVLREPSEVAREIAAGHPAVSDIGFGEDEIQLWFKGRKGLSAKINAAGEVQVHQDAVDWMPLPKGAKMTVELQRRFDESVAAHEKRERNGD